MRTKSLKERFYHATGFEVLAILLVSPLAAWLMEKPLFQMGALALTLSTLAMGWNIVYNAGFDRMVLSVVKRGLWLRMLHAVGFETGFIAIGLPIAAWMLDITVWQAFLLEITFFLFFLPYTVAYNWLYDMLRSKLVQRKQCRI